MTFIDLSRTDLEGGPLWSTASIGPRPIMAKRRRPLADEDGARKALGMDQPLPVSLLAGASLEHLARIALG